MQRVQVLLSREVMRPSKRVTKEQADKENVSTNDNGNSAGRIAKSMVNSVHGPLKQALTGDAARSLKKISPGDKSSVRAEGAKMLKGMSPWDCSVAIPPKALPSADRLHDCRRVTAQPQAASMLKPKVVATPNATVASASVAVPLKSASSATAKVVRKGPFSNIADRLAQRSAANRLNKQSFPAALDVLESCLPQATQARSYAEVVARVSLTNPVESANMVIASIGKISKPLNKARTPASKLERRTSMEIDSLEVSQALQERAQPKPIAQHETNFQDLLQRGRSQEPEETQPPAVSQAPENVFAAAKAVRQRLQELIERKRAREEDVKTKEYKKLCVERHRQQLQRQREFALEQEKRAQEKNNKSYQDLLHRSRSPANSPTGSPKNHQQQQQQQHLSHTQVDNDLEQQRVDTKQHQPHPNAARFVASLHRLAASEQDQPVNPFQEQYHQQAPNIQGSLPAQSTKKHQSAHSNQSFKTIQRAKIDQPQHHPSKHQVANRDGYADPGHQPRQQYQYECEEYPHGFATVPTRVGKRSYSATIPRESTTADIIMVETKAEAKPEKRVKYVQAEEDWSAYDQANVVDQTLESEYSEDIFAHMHAMETKLVPPSDYLDSMNEKDQESRQDYINFISITAYKLQFVPETSLLAVNLLDRAMAQMGKLSRGNGFFVAICCLLLAAKYEEVSYAPYYDFFVELLVVRGKTDMTKERFVKGEYAILDLLKYDLGWPGPLSFLRRCSRADDTDESARLVAKYILEVCMLNHRFVPVKPSLMAAAAMYLGRCTQGREDWPEIMVHYSGGYTLNDIKSVVHEMAHFLLSKAAQESSVYSTYSQKVYSFASRYTTGRMVDFLTPREINHGTYIAPSINLMFCPSRGQHLPDSLQAHEACSHFKRFPVRMPDDYTDEK